MWDGRDLARRGVFGGLDGELDLVAVKWICHHGRGAQVERDAVANGVHETLNGRVDREENPLVLRGREEARDVCESLSDDLEIDQPALIVKVGHFGKNQVGPNGASLSIEAGRADRGGRVVAVDVLRQPAGIRDGLSPLHQQIVQLDGFEYDGFVDVVIALPLPFPLTPDTPQTGLEIHDLHDDQLELGGPGGRE